jgi:GTPase involved in cell partitioning and DNA repair
MCDGGKAIRRPTEGRRFVDRSRIVVAGGQGGAGCVSFFRDTRNLWGGPDGGPGGDGGNIVVRASSKLVDLSRDRYTYIGGNGLNGKGDNQIGRAGRDVIIEVPVGTLVKVFPASEGFLGPDALREDEWAPQTPRRKRRNRQARDKEIDDTLEDTQVSSYMQQMHSDENRKSSAPAGPRPSKFASGKGAEHFARRRSGRPPLAAFAESNEGEEQQVQVGSWVKVREDVEEPEYGWGDMVRGSVGVVTGFDEDADVVVDFAEHKGWVGVAQELHSLGRQEPTEDDLAEEEEGEDAARAGGAEAEAKGRGWPQGGAVDVTDISIEDLWSGKYKGGGNRAQVGEEGTGEQGEDVEGSGGGRVRWQQEQAEAYADLSEEGQEVVVARGGRGGRGNVSFATKQHRAPKKATSGAGGQRLRYIFIYI